MKLPPGWSLTTLEPNPSTPLPDLRAAVEGALAQPLHSPRLSHLAAPALRVCLVFTDATRACPDHILVPAILRELERAGVPDDHITLLCATGLHRPSTREEKIAKLGAKWWSGIEWSIMIRLPVSHRTCRWVQVFRVPKGRGISPGKARCFASLTPCPRSGGALGGMTSQ